MDGVKMCDWSHLNQESGTWPAIVVNFDFRKGHTNDNPSSINVFIHKFTS